jgi:hypothetical protein
MAPLTPFEELVEFIMSGEAVSAQVAGRPDRALAKRTQHLREILQKIQAGQALELRDVAIEADAVPGNAVYYNDVTKQYERALAAIECDVDQENAFKATDSSFPVGVVFSKSSSTKGNLVTWGTVAGVNLANLIDGDPNVPGQYYLSTKTPGKVTLQKPGISVLVMISRGDGCIHLTPSPRDLLESHVHYRFKLTALPAGDAVCGDQEDPTFRHEVLNPDTAKPGWLPADHASFAGAAPPGALFGYNLSQDPKLQQVFPPIPVESAFVEVNHRTAAMPPCTNPLIKIDSNGIWWFGDCYGNAPWAPQFPGCIPSSEVSGSSASGAPAACGTTPIEYQIGHGGAFDEEKIIVLGYSRMLLKTDRNVVTSLEPADGSPITVEGCTDDAKTGALQLGFDFGQLNTIENEIGFQVFKELTGATIKRGPVVEGVRAGPEMAISGIGTEGTDWAFDSERNLWFGQLLLSFAPAGANELKDIASLVAQDNVREELPDGTFMQSFPQGRRSSLRARVELPDQLPVDGAGESKMEILAWFVGRAAGDLPELNASYRRIPQALTLAPLPTTDTPVDTGVWDPGITIATPGTYVEALSPAFDVAAGETVFFTLEREGTDAHPGDVSILRLGYRITPKT